MFKHRRLLKWDITLLILICSALLTSVLLIQQLRQFNLTTSPAITFVPSEPTAVSLPTQQDANPSAPAAANDAPTEVIEELPPSPAQFFSPVEIERHQTLGISQRLLSDLGSVPVARYSDSIPNIPKDILDQLTYGTPGGGGPGCIPDHEFPRVGGIFQNPTFLGEEFKVFHTGWAATGETLISRLILPNNELIEDIRTTENFLGENIIGCESYQYTTDWIDPIGEYKLSLTGDEATINASVHVIAPTEPTIFETDNGILLYGFAPYERIRIFIYDFDQNQQVPGDLVGWDSFAAGKDGIVALLISTELLSDTYAYFVVGEDSGWARGGTNLFIPPISGANFFNVVTAVPQIETLQIRAAPGTDQPIVAELPNQTELFVIEAGRYEISTGTHWLPVRTKNGIDGWIEESKVQVLRLAQYEEVPK